MEATIQIEELIRKKLVEQYYATILNYITQAIIVFFILFYIQKAFAFILLYCQILIKKEEK